MLALDIGARMLQHDAVPLEAEGYTEHQVLMVVHVPKGLDPVGDTLHKIGTTGDVFVPIPLGAIIRPQEPPHITESLLRTI